MKGMILMSRGGAKFGGDFGGRGGGENRGENRRNHHFLVSLLYPPYFI